MDAATTAKLVELITGTWPSGPKGHVWSRVVASLDPPAAAHQAWRNLARTEQKITVAQFVAEHNRLVLASDHSSPLADCVHCEHGWRQVHEEHGGHIYDACEPCSCPAGRAHVDTHQRILDDNRIELNRVIPGRAERTTTEQQEAQF